MDYTIESVFELDRVVALSIVGGGFDGFILACQLWGRYLADLLPLCKQTVGMGSARSLALLDDISRYT